MNNTADIIIIGGGVQGASLAFHLAQRRVRSILLEKKFIAAGATGRSSGLVRMHYDAEVDSRLAWTSFQYFRNWKERVGGDSGFTRTGFIQIVAPDKTDKLKLNVTMQQRIGIPTLLVTADDVKRLAPSFVTDDFECAAYEPESGYAMPSDTANSLMNAAQAGGARLGSRRLPKNLRAAESQRHRLYKRADQRILRRRSSLYGWVRQLVLPDLASERITLDRVWWLH